MENTWNVNYQNQIRFNGILFGTFRFMWLSCFKKVNWNQICTVIITVYLNCAGIFAIEFKSYFRLNNVLVKDFLPYVDSKSGFIFWRKQPIKIVLFQNYNSFKYMGIGVAMRSKVSKYLPFDIQVGTGAELSLFQ